MSERPDAADCSIIDITDDETSLTEKPQEKSEPVSLSLEQLETLAAVTAGSNVFITGSAGVGKSFVLKEAMKILDPHSTFVTASTGVAACNISGTTLHSFAGIGLGDAPVATLLRNLQRRRAVKERWAMCKALVIDEISMIDGELFEKVEEIARKVKGVELPFGGIQLILCGDFLQLPPVQKQNEKKKFCFEVAAWKRCIDKTILLKKVFRQKEEELVAMLNRIRLGDIIKKDVCRLQKSKFTVFREDDGIKPTRLFPHRASCDLVNDEQLDLLPGEVVTYDSKDTGDDEYLRQLNKSSKFPEVLSLKVGAQVMLLKNLNLETGLVNGTRGVITGFSSQKDMQLDELDKNHPHAEEIEQAINKNVTDNFRHPLVRFVNGEEMMLAKEKATIEVAGREVASRVQLPLALAWAVSIHKAQGMTLERVELSLRNVFEYGQAYVALSRCTSLSGLRVSGFAPSNVKAHPKVLSYYKSLNEQPSNEHLFNASQKTREAPQLPRKVPSTVTPNAANHPTTTLSSLTKNSSRSYTTTKKGAFSSYFTKKPSRQSPYHRQKVEETYGLSPDSFIQSSKRPPSPEIPFRSAKQRKGNFGKNILMKPAVISSFFVCKDDCSDRGNHISDTASNKDVILVD